MSSRGPVLLREAVPAAMAPGRANGLHVGVVGDEECWPVLRGAHKAAIGSPQSRLYVVVHNSNDPQIVSGGGAELRSAGKVSPAGAGGVCELSSPRKMMR